MLRCFLKQLSLTSLNKFLEVKEKSRPFGATIHQAKFVREKEKLVDGHDSPKALHHIFFRKAINYTLWSLDNNLTIFLVLITSQFG